MNIKIDALAQSIRASIAKQSPSAAIAYVLAKVAVELRSITRNPSVAEYLSANESISLQIFKALSDAVEVMDNAESEVRGNTYTDTSSAIDTIQLIMQYIRNLSEIATATDASSITIEKQITDAVTAIDAITSLIVGSARNEADSAGTTDILAFAVEKLIQDPVLATDVLDRVVSYFRDYTDTANAVDALSFAMQLEFSDSVNVSDVLQIVNDVPVSNTDSLSLSDQAAYQFTKAAIDSLVVTDEILVVPIKGFDETVGATDFIVITTGLSKELFESLTAGDSGLLFMTDYADITYFAEDYVGTSRTF